MKMYIGNGLHQNVDFQYRLPRYKSPKMQTILVGGQIQISGELTPDEIDKIILQHAVYGMVGIREFRNYRAVKIPYIYSVDLVIPFEILVELIEQNRGYNDALGVKLRQDAAVALNDIIESNAPMVPGIPKRKVNNLELTVEEVSTKDHDGTMSEGVIVTRDKNRGAPQQPGIIERVTAPMRSLF